MSTRLTQRRMAGFLVAAVALVMACSVSTNTGPELPQQPPVFDATNAALQLQGTAMALQLTQAALNVPQQLPPANPAAAIPTENAPAPIPQVVATPTQDIEARIKSAKILVYENTDERGWGMWVQDALDGMGLKATNTGSYSGHFMEYLNSGIKYDLVIVDAEDKDRIQGEFWDVINSRLGRDKVALIAEVWDLDRQANGPISKILGPCGVRFRKDMPLDDSIYWWVPDHPVFNEPNTVLPLIHVNRMWANQAGDKLMLGGSGDATMIAGLSARTDPGEGVLASCFQGRVIIQTFSDHDYRQADIVPLWQNYIHYTLKNHFLVTP